MKIFGIKVSKQKKKEKATIKPAETEIMPKKGKFQLFKPKTSENADIDAKTGKKRIAEKELQNDKFYYEAQDFNSEYGLTKSQIKKERKLKKKNPDKIVLIKMAMANGQFREFLIVEKLGHFLYNKGLYILDVKMKFYLIERNIWAYNFHEYMALPFKEKWVISDEIEAFLNEKYAISVKKPLNPHINTTELRTIIANSGLREIADVEASLNPINLRRFVDSELAAQIMRGAMLGRIFKIMFIILIIIGIIELLHFIISLWSSGIFEKIGNVFHKG